MNTDDYKTEWYDFLNQQKYRYFLTLTFTIQVSPSLQITSLNFLFHILNRKLFGKKYKEKGKYLKGFSFREGLYLINPHYHFLIQEDDIFNNTNKPSFEYHLFNLLPKVKNPNGKRLFSSKGVFVEDVYSEKIIEYCNKSMWMNNDDYIGILSKDGIIQI